jgi:ribose transport system substrate-binding protein
LRPAAIVVQTVSGEGLPRVARDAVNAGIGWVLLSTDAPYVDSLHDEYPDLPVSVVTTDQLSIRRIQGQQFRSLLPAGGSIIYIQGPAGTSGARLRLQGMEEAIAGSNINVKVLTAEWTEGSGERAVLSWLRLSSTATETLNLVGAQNDAMAVGARKAIAARRPQWLDLPFTGCDGIPESGQRLVNEGQLAATVIMQANAGPAIDLIAAQLTTRQPAPARVVLRRADIPRNVHAASADRSARSQWPQVSCGSRAPWRRRPYHSRSIPLTEVTPCRPAPGVRRVSLYGRISRCLRRFSSCAAN